MGESHGNLEAAGRLMADVFAYLVAVCLALFAAWFDVAGGLL